jgi:hypothetical protein
MKVIVMMSYWKNVSAINKVKVKLLLPRRRSTVISAQERYATGKKSGVIMSELVLYCNFNGK